MNYRATFSRLALLVVALCFTCAAAIAKDPPKTVDSLAATFPDSLDISGKVVYVDFWASWCQPCRKSFPFMERLLLAHKADGLVIIAVNLDKDSSAAAAFLAKNNAPFHIIYDPDGVEAKRFHLKAIPTSFVYGRDGNLRNTHQGFEPADTTALASLVDQLLKEKPNK